MEAARAVGGVPSPTPVLVQVQIKPWCKQPCEAWCLSCPELLWVHGADSGAMFLSADQQGDKQAAEEGKILSIAVTRWLL